MEHTEYYQLSLWEQDDRIQMEDFNSNNAKIDAALAEMPRIATGTYTGTGECGSAHKNTLTFDFVPQMVIVRAVANAPACAIWTAGAERACTYTASSHYCIFSLTGNTLSWYSPDTDAGQQLNYSGSSYTYLALG